MTTPTTPTIEQPSANAPSGWSLLSLDDIFRFQQANEMTQKDLAEYLDISVPSLYQWKHKDVVPHLATQERLRTLITRGPASQITDSPKDEMNLRILPPSLPTQQPAVKKRRGRKPKKKTSLDDLNGHGQPLLLLVADYIREGKTVDDLIADVRALKDTLNLA